MNPQRRYNSIIILLICRIADFHRNSSFLFIVIRRSLDCLIKSCNTLSKQKFCLWRRGGGDFFLLQKQQLPVRVIFISYFSPWYNLSHVINLNVSQPHLSRVYLTAPSNTRNIMEGNFFGIYPHSPSQIVDRTETHFRIWLSFFKKTSLIIKIANILFLTSKRQVILE